jgi:tRNA (cytidine/uridine-2'-O-)-methyltransferase
MDTSRSLKTLNITTPLPFNFRSRASLLRPFCLSQLKKHFNPSLPLSQCYSPFCSQCNTLIKYLSRYAYDFFFIMFWGCLLFNFVGVAGRGNGNSLPDGVGKGVNEVSRNKKLLQVVLVSPQVLAII